MFTFAMFTILLEAANRNPSKELMFSGNAVFFLWWIDLFQIKVAPKFIEMTSFAQLCCCCCYFHCNKIRISKILEHPFSNIS